MSPLDLIEPVATPPPAAVRVLVDASRDEWDDYVERHPAGSVDHLWAWRDVIARVFGHRSVYLTAKRGTRAVGVLPLVLFRSAIFGRAVVSMPFLNDGGVLADDQTARGALLAQAVTVARAFGAQHVELRHRARQCADLPFRQHKLGLTLRLPATSDALWARLDRRVRNQVRKAQKEGLSILVGGADLVGAFYRVFSRNMRDLGTPVYSPRLFQDVLRTFPDRARVFLVRDGRVPVAAGISLRGPHGTLVPWASSLREYRSRCPNMLLYWAMLEQAVADGSGVFDFGRSSPGSGTHQFKLQWGAEAEPLHWEYVVLGKGGVPDQTPSSPRFRPAIELWKRCPLWLTNAVGPHIVRAIP
jgi:FemAB-related protein (PEP-CTERM system-associated)